MTLMNWLQVCAINWIMLCRTIYQKCMRSSFYKKGSRVFSPLLHRNRDIAGKRGKEQKTHSHLLAAAD